MARHRWMFASGEQRNANQGYSTQLSIQRRQHAELSITTQKRLRYQQHSTHRRGRNHGRGDSRRGRRGRTHRQLTKLNRKLVERGIFAIFDKSCWIFASGEQGNANQTYSTELTELRLQRRHAARNSAYNVLDISAAHTDEQHAPTRRKAAQNGRGRRGS